MTFATPEEADKARENLNGTVVEGRKIEVRVRFNLFSLLTFVSLKVLAVHWLEACQLLN